MKRDHGFHAGGAPQTPRLMRGQVKLLRGAFGVGGEKWRFDEQQVCARSKRHDVRRILRLVGDIGDIGELLSGHDFEDALLEFAERNQLLVHSALRRPPYPKRCCIRSPGEDRVLELAQPWAGRETECLEPVLPDVDMLFFLKREAEARRAVIEQRAAYPERRLVEKDAVIDRQLVLVLAPERGLAAKAGTPRHAARMDLSRFGSEVSGVTPGKVPGACDEPARHLADESGRAVKPHT